MTSSSLAAAQLGRLRQSPAERGPRFAASPPGRLPSSPLTVSFSSSIRAPAIEVAYVSNGRSPVIACGTKYLMGSVNKTDGLKFAVVVARFNEIITNLLLEGALETFRRYSIDDDDVTVVKVPGSFEVPVVAQRLGKSGKYDAILCIGAVVWFGLSLDTSKRGLGRVWI